MICKNCGKETSYVICENCGINVIWYNKYGCQFEIESVDELGEPDVIYPKTDFEDDLKSIFTPDGSGD